MTDISASQDDNNSGVPNALALVVVVFFLSGASSLMYEVLWVRMFTLLFGNTTQAVRCVGWLPPGPGSTANEQASGQRTMRNRAVRKGYKLLLRQRSDVR